MKIGNVELKNAIALAPMAGVTDLPFRLLCKEQGCGLMYTEMVSAKALLYKNRNTKPLLETRPEEEPVAVQLFWLRSGDYERDGAAAGGRTVCHHRRQHGLSGAKDCQ